MKIPLVGQSYQDRSPAVGLQASINVFPRLITDANEQEKNKAVLYGRPGKHLLAALGGLGLADVRGLWSGAGRLFVAAGLNLLEISQSGSVISNHAYASADDGLPVQIFSNGNQLLIITDGKAYCDSGSGPVACVFFDSSAAGTINGFTSNPNVQWVSGDLFNTDGSWAGLTITLGGTPYVVQQVLSPTQLVLTTSPSLTLGMSYSLTAPNAVTAVTGGYLDGTFFVQRPPTAGQVNFGRQVNFSNLLDGTQWSALNFFSKESSPDAIRGIHVDNEQLYLMGAEGSEIWMSNPNATATQTPYSRAPGATCRYGLLSAYGIDSLDGNVYFLGGDDRGGPVAYVFNGFTPVRISNHAIEAQWNKASLGWQAVTYGYQEDGQSLWCINFGPSTWCYDPELGAWHQRMEGPNTGFTPYQTNLHTFIPEWTVAGQMGVHITAGTGATGANVYISSLSFWDDAGSDIDWQRVLPYIYAGGVRQYFGRMVLEAELGTTDAGTPTIVLDYSDDRGANYINPRPFSIGTPEGFEELRAWINRNGSSKGRIFRLSGGGQKKVVLIDLDVDVVTGTV